MVGRIEVEKLTREGREIGAISTALSSQDYSIRGKQEDLLDLMTALLKFNCFVSTTVAMQCTFQRSPSYSLITVDIKSLDQHNC